MSIVRTYLVRTVRLTVHKNFESACVRVLVCSESVMSALCPLQ